MEEKTKVFVYGSLLSTLSNNYLLKDSTLLGMHETEEEYTMYEMGYFPGVRKGGTTSIKGEVYDVDLHTLSRLDILEGTPTFYHRHHIETNYGKAIMYLLTNTCNAPIVFSGDWKAHLQGDTKC